MLTDTLIYTASPNPERPTKRKASSPMSADEGGFATLSAVSYVDYILPDEEPIVKPIAKKRRVITSDDENLPDDGPVATTSKVPKKGTKRSSRAQTKPTGKSASQALESSSKKVVAVELAEDGADDVLVSDEEELAAASTT